MPDIPTSPEIIILVVLAAALTLFAWWLSNRQMRRFRDFVSWIEEHHGARWQSLPGASWKLNRGGGVERLRREGLGDDPEFMTRYRYGKRVRWPQVVSLACGMGAIALIAAGIEYFGWNW